MCGRLLTALITAAGLTLVLLGPSPARTETPPTPPAQPPEGLEVLGRGPVHEAYAQPLDSRPEPAPAIPREPPAAIDEEPPDQKPEGTVWIPGYWQWDDNKSDFVWVSGFWRKPPPGRTWVPGSYRKTDDGWQWVPGAWMSPNQDPNQLSVVPEPPASVENGPSQPAPVEDSLYVPGSWVYRESRFVWRPGYWSAYRPDLVWIPAHYCWTPAGCVFVDGYWDYPLANRGLLFAPVRFATPLYTDPGYTYTPSFVVAADFLPTALFVRPACGHYYFGDYFGDSYLNAGYCPWVTYRVWGGYDPLFAFGRVSYGPTWATGLRGLYADRLAGTAPLPPRTFGAQQALARNLATNRPGFRNVRSVTPLTPLAQVQDPNLRLAPVSAAQRVQARQNASQLRGQARQRVNRGTPQSPGVSTLRSAPSQAPAVSPAPRRDLSSPYLPGRQGPRNGFQPDPGAVSSPRIRTVTPAPQAAPRFTAPPKAAPTPPAHTPRTGSAPQAYRAAAVHSSPPQHHQAPAHTTAAPVHYSMPAQHAPAPATHHTAPPAHHTAPAPPRHSAPPSRPSRPKH